MIGIYAAGKFADKQKLWQVYTESISAALRQIIVTIIYYYILHDLYYRLRLRVSIIFWTHVFYKIHNIIGDTCSRC